MEKRKITFYLKNITYPIDVIEESDQTMQEIQVEIKRLFTTKQVIMFENEQEFLIARPSDLITVKVCPYVEEDLDPMKMIMESFSNKEQPSDDQGPEQSNCIHEFETDGGPCKHCGETFNDLICEKKEIKSENNQITISDDNLTLGIPNDEKDKK